MPQDQYAGSTNISAILFSPPLNKNTYHFSSIQAPFLFIPEGFKNLTLSQQSKILMEFGIGEGREGDCFREENYSLLSPIRALCFSWGENNLVLEGNNIIFRKISR